MSKFLRTRVMEGMKYGGFKFVNLPPSATPHTRGVRYFMLANFAKDIRGAMDSVKAGQKHQKRIVVRPSRFRVGLYELYTFHFPKHWSQACVANRELIKQAQRQAHAIERDFSPEKLEWKIRFLKQLYTLPACTKEHKDLPLEKRRYPHFYTYVFAVLYHQLRNEARHAQEEKAISDAELQRLAEEVSFVPVLPSRSPYFRRSWHKNANFYRKTCICQEKAVPLSPFMISP